MNNRIVISLCAVVFGLLAGAVLMLATGHNAGSGYSYLFEGGLKNAERIGNTLATATPLILSGLSVAFAFRTGLFNIGVAGQLLVGGFCASVVGLGLDLPKVLLLPVMLIVGAAGGALWAVVPGLLKARFNVHEVVSSIMMNWVGFWTVYYGVQSLIKNPSSETESKQLPEAATLKAAWLTDLFHGSYINLGLLVAVVIVLVIAFIINKTTFGYELKAVGHNRDAAEYAGIAVNRSIVYSMAISGAIAGLGGVVMYAGNASNIQIGILPSQGFDGIAVSLLGANNPFGVLLSAIFFGLLYSGRGFMNAMTDIPPEIADSIIAIIIYFSATSILIERLLRRFKRRRANAKIAAVQEGKVKKSYVDNDR
ncbi:ABC transporter permease [Cohnella pontilimi]|uniref:ABC transporter permease n=1 Tax=Cohnella pontilimi TaxID=2564100 RepID=A0A4V5LS15_9BACL|nr:ABC transporter permease [Cohnella pontilimi]TJY41389.1 ABC transporter permease [Cohnella pontilimi]